MKQQRPSSDNRAQPTRVKTRPPLKDRSSTKLLRLVFTAVIAVALAVGFIKMIMPGKDDEASRHDAVMTADTLITAESELETPADTEESGPDAAGEAVRAYRGQAGEPIDDPKITWEIALEMSDRALQLLEGTIVTRKFAGELPESDFFFSITPNSYLMNLSESGTVTVRLDDTYDPVAAALFSINDKDQFFVLLTPKKLSIPSGSLPTRFLTERENSTLISMQGFIRTDDTIVGTFRSIFGPNIEYVLEPFTTE